MTPRHPGERLSLAGFAARASIAAVTMRKYISAGIESNPVPRPCGTEPLSGRRWWCEKHADKWIANRPRAKREPNPRKEQQ